MLALREGVRSAVTLEEWAGRIEKGAKERALSVYRFAHGWKIVGKTFHGH